MAGTAKVHVIHENPDWLPPLRAAFEALGTPYEEWLLDRHVLDLASVPPQGVFFSRMSASNYTRGHAHANQSSQLVLRWLEAHGRRVVNGSDVLALELSKAAQQLALDRAGFATPRTVAAVGASRIRAAASALELSPFILKPNQGGKGAGVRLFETLAELDRTMAQDGPGASPDDVWLVQERIATADDFITRLEFIGGRFQYAVKVFSAGSFELCPADFCETPEAGPRFEIDSGFDDPLTRRLEGFLADHAIEVAGIEFIRRPDGTPVIYDINTNTNYNAGAEARAGLGHGGMARIAAFLDGELRRQGAPTKSRAAAG